MFNEINKVKRKYEYIIIGLYIVAAIIFIFLAPAILRMNIDGDGAGFLMISPFLGASLFAGIFYASFKKLSTTFKVKYVPQELKKVFPNSTYNPHKGISESEVIDSRILKNEDRYHTEDLITGKFDNINFRCADVHQQDVRRSGKHTTVVTVFKGRFYEFDFNKNFKHDLLLLQPGKFRPFSNFQKIKMESVHFNSEIKVYAKNEHEAFYILTPHFMEKLLYLDNKYRDKISFSFHNNKLYIAIDNRIDSFDVRLFHRFDESIISDYEREFNDMKEFITLLNLTSRLFK